MRYFATRVKFAMQATRKLMHFVDVTQSLQGGLCPLELGEKCDFDTNTECDVINHTTGESTELTMCKQWIFEETGCHT